MKRIFALGALLTYSALGAFHTSSATASQVVVNGGFENGTVSWQVSSRYSTAGVTTLRAHTGTQSAVFCGTNYCSDLFRQYIRLPVSYSSASLNLWALVTAITPGTGCLDALTVTIQTTSNVVLATAPRACNSAAGQGWLSYSVDVSAALAARHGQYVQVVLRGSTGYGRGTKFYADDVALSLSGTGTNPTLTPTPTAGGSATGSGSISADPFSAFTVGQHRTEVEPDTFSYGNTVVAAFQVGRIYDGGSVAIGWATSINGSWTHGLLPGLTVSSTPAGQFDRATDASVAYDAMHRVWLISTLGLVNGTYGPVGTAVLTSRSTDGYNWSNPVPVSTTGSGDYDKNWIACDNGPSSPYYGHCYSEWDDNGAGNRLLMSTSTDGGQTWGAALDPQGSPSGLGGQPVVQPNGTVIVPASGNESSIISFRSTDGGATWSSASYVTGVSRHSESGGLRSGPLPSAEVDSSGKVYVVWADCRFEAACAANDVVMVTTSDGIAWSPITRIPIDPVDSGVDHFIPGLAVSTASSGPSARLALTYYYYPQSACSTSTCQLKVGIISSTNGGSSWSAPSSIGGPMSLSALPSTSQGVMVGDYISTSFDGAVAVPAYPVAGSLTSGTFNEAMYSVREATGSALQPAGPIAPRSGTTRSVSRADQMLESSLPTRR